MSDPQSSSGQEPIESTTGAEDLAVSPAQHGAADAAARTWTATGRFLDRFVYTTCYTLSYGVVFPSVYLARSVPVNNAAVRGLIEGAQAAWHKVDEVRHHALATTSDVAAPAFAPT